MHFSKRPQKVDRRFMNSIHELIDIAIKLLQSGELPRACEALEAASRDSDSARDLNLVWAMYHIQKGDSARAREALDRELALFPDNDVAIALRGDLQSDGSRNCQVPSVVSPHPDLVARLMQAISSQDVKSRVLEVLTRFDDECLHGSEISRIKQAIRNKSYWYEPSQFLEWWSAACRPNRYLALGIGSGKLLAQVAVRSPSTALYGVSFMVQERSNAAGVARPEGLSGEELRQKLSRLAGNSIPKLFYGALCDDLQHVLGCKNNPIYFDLISLDGADLGEAAHRAFEVASAHLAPGGALVVSGVYNQSNIRGLWLDFKAKCSDYLFLEQHYNHGTGIAIRPPFDKLSQILEQGNVRTPSGVGRKLRILMPYSVKRRFGKITLPEWLKDSLRAYYSDEVEVFACGPENEIDMPDSPDFYRRVASLIDELEIDVLLDVEGGAETLDFMFKRLPEGISIPKVFWAIDTHQFLPLQIEKAKHFDIVYSAQHNAVSALGEHARWLPAGASMHELDLLRERTIPVAFVGSLTPAHARRRKTLQFLSQQLPDVQLLTDVFLAEKAEVLSRTKIAVNVSLNNDINFRVFETMATGAMLLTDRIHGNGMESLFVEGVHYVAFDSDEDLVRKARYYLAHPEEREKIARAGQQLVDSKYRHFHALSRVLDDVRDFMVKKCLESQNVVQRKFDRKCWCGGTLFPSVHPLYKRCGACDTQVLDKIYSEEELKRFYSAQGYWRDRQVQVFNFPPIEQRASNDFHDRIPIWFETLSHFKKSPHRLLEIGCAHGGFLSYCRERGARDIVGVEVDEETCKFARTRFNIEHVVAGLFPEVNLPFESFDAITGFDVIEHFRDPIAGLQGVAERLADDGICFFQTPCYRGEGEEWTQFKPAEHTFLYTEGSIRKLFKRVGLEVIEIRQGCFRDDMFVIGRKRASHKKVGFIRTDGIGDNVLATGLITPLAQKYDTKLIVVCADYVAPLYENHPDVEQVFPFDWRRLIADEKYLDRFGQFLELLDLDVVLNSVYSRNQLVDYLAAACNASESIAFHGNLSNISAELRAQSEPWYTHIIEDSKEPHFELIEMRRHEQFLQALSTDPTSVKPVLTISEQDRLVADEILIRHGVARGGYVALGAISSSAVKDYPYWPEALGDVCRDHDLTVLALGSLQERGVVQEMLQRIGVRSVNLCGETTLMESAAIISQAKLVAASDTSIPHIASVLSVPNVVVVGGGHFGRFFPYSSSTAMVCLPLECYGCSWRCSYSEAHCVTGINPRVVAEAIRYTLEGVGSKPRVFVQSSSVTRPESDIELPNQKPLSNFLNTDAVEVVMVAIAGQTDAVSDIGRSLNERPGESKFN